MWSELGHKCRRKPLDDGMEWNSGSHHPLGAGLGVGAEGDLRPVSARAVWATTLISPSVRGENVAMSFEWQQMEEIK